MAQVISASFASDIEQNVNESPRDALSSDPLEVPNVAERRRHLSTKSHCNNLCAIMND